MNTFLWNQIELSNLRDCKGCKAVFLLLTDLTLPLQPFLRKEAHPLFWLLPLKSLNLSMGHSPFLALIVRRPECAEIKNMGFTGKQTFQTLARPAGTLGPVMSSLRPDLPHLERADISKNRHKVCMTCIYKGHSLPGREKDLKPIT